MVNHAKREINDKVAPGLEISFEVTFCPEEKIDYSSQLVVVTENGDFTVPIMAVGIRGMCSTIFDSDRY
jgi:hypothetical protein